MTPHPRPVPLIEVQAAAIISGRAVPAVMQSVGPQSFHGHYGGAAVPYVACMYMLFRPVFAYEGLR